MFHYCLLLVLLLIILIKNDKTIEAIENEEGELHTSETVDSMNQQEQLTELERLRRSNYSDARGFENMMNKGMCTNEPDTDTFHSCKIKDPSESKQMLDLRYINPGSNTLDNSTDYTYLSHCPEKYKETIDILVSDQLKPDPELFKMTLDPTIPNPDNFFENKFSRGQYPGYTRNNYLDRTRYIKSDEPLPINPDFFMDGGGTYA